MTHTARVLTINLIGLLGALFVAAIALSSGARTTELSRIAHETITVKEDALREILLHAGYGGAIHHAKNYVLRQDPVYAERFEVSASKVRTAIDRYRAADGMTAQEMKAIERIEEMIDAYSGAVTLARDLGNTAEGIDREVRIDDTEFVASVEFLNKINQQALAEISESILATTNRTRTTVLASSLVVTIVVGLAGTLVAIAIGRKIARDARAVHEEIEHRERACRIQDEFLANMSHEIRTPMTSILGFANVLGNPDDNPAIREMQQEAVPAIQRSAKHLLSVINDILDVAKLRAGQVRIEPLNVCPRSLADEVVSILRPPAHEKGITVTLRSETNLPAWISADPVRLRQILMNLVGNAIKFTDKGGVTLSISCEDDGQQRIRYDVIDTGIGIDQEGAETVFRAFQQVDSSATRKFGGTGLGLHISAQLARLMNGNISFTSEPGHGTTFSLVLTPEALGPVTVPRLFSESDELLEHYEMPTTLPLRGYKVLLAEDGVDNQKLISLMLEASGASVTIVEDGKKMLEACCVDADHEGPLLDPVPFDIILTDMQMPVMDGYTSTDLFRRKGGKTPVVAVTAHAMTGDRERCLNAGCDAFVTKPIDPSRLIATCLARLGKQGRSGHAAA